MTPSDSHLPARPPPSSERFRLGPWVVDPGSDEIIRGQTRVRVEPKAMDVLAYLAAHAGEVVSREELERHVWRGALVGYDAVTSTIIKLRKALGDSTAQPQFIATVPKRGYRLIAPVARAEPEVTSQAVTPCVTPSESALAGSWSSWLRRPVVIVSMLVVIAALLAAVFLATTQPPSESSQVSRTGTSAPPSIVVLPFENLSEDPQQEQFADGMTEDIVTDLSRMSDLLVIASNTSFAFKGKRTSAQAIAAELGVDFVLEGSIRRRGDSIRINAHLVDTHSGFQAWAERYDRPAVEVFAVQDEVTGNIVRALAVTLTPQEEERLARRSTGNLSAYDQFQAGQRLGRIYTKETNIQAQAAYRRAIGLDPGYGRAYGALAYTLASNYRRGWTDTPQLTVDRALELARRAVALDPSIPHTYWALGYVHLMRRELEDAETAVTRALSIAPNYADGYGLLALIKNALGEPEAALALIDKGVRLNPYYTWDYPYNRGRAYYALGRIEEAIAALEEARSRNENAVPVRLHLAASYARAGRLDDAEWEVQEIQVMSPSDTISQLRNAHPIANPDLMGALIDDLRKAGLPE